MQPERCESGLSDGQTCRRIGQESVFRDRHSSRNAGYFDLQNDSASWHGGCFTPIHLPEIAERVLYDWGCGRIRSSSGWNRASAHAPSHLHSLFFYWLSSESRSCTLLPTTTDFLFKTTLLNSTITCLSVDCCFPETFSALPLTCLL